MFSDEFRAWSDGMSEIMDVAVKKAIAENRRLGLVPDSPPACESSEAPSTTIRVEESAD